MIIQGIDVLLNSKEVEYLTAQFGQFNSVVFNEGFIMVDEKYQVPVDKMIDLMNKNESFDKEQFANVSTKRREIPDKQKIINKCVSVGRAEMICILRQAKMITDEDLMRSLVIMLDEKEFVDFDECADEIKKHLSPEEWKQFYQELNILDKVHLLQYKPQKYQGDFSIDECAKIALDNTFDDNDDLSKFVQKNIEKISDGILIRLMRCFHRKNNLIYCDEIKKRNLFPKCEKIYEKIINTSCTAEYRIAYDTLMQK